MLLLRRLLGDVLRRHRMRQSRTLRDVSAAAGVSLGYLSEVERGRKEASSELLAAICAALGVSMSEVLREVSDDLATEERRRRLTPVGFSPSPAVRPVAGVAPVVPGHHRPAVPAGAVPAGAVPAAVVPAAAAPVAVASLTPSLVRTLHAFAA